jgi:hypothetical protein
VRRLVPVVSVLIACRPEVEDDSTDLVTVEADGVSSTDDTETSTPAEQCASVCDGYAACGCAQRCQSWCDSYLDWFVCNAEIEALIACATTHPSPCTWAEESWSPEVCEQG